MREKRNYRKFWMEAEQALEDIRDMLSGKEWTPDTLESIAERLRREGFEIEPPNHA